MKEHFQLKETIVTIVADDRSYIEVAKNAISKHRLELEEHIRADPYFNLTLEPYECSEDAPDIIQRLVAAGNSVGIGPMSAVAGTIAALAVEAMVSAGATYAIVDNGGDIAIINDKPVVIGIYAGSSSIKNIGFSLEPSDHIRGICTSSGTVGPSINFGDADAAVVFSDDVSLADSAATELSNSTGIGHNGVESSFNAISSIPGIDGAVVIQGEHMGFWGSVPQMTRANVQYECITKG